jgi:succinate-semialdehyde dehydrogenase/glutarate-semialdehyde dehydrogenase
MNSIDAINPVTGEKLKTYECTDPKQVQLIVENAHKAQKSWAQTPLKTRLNNLKTLNKLYLKRLDVLAETISADVGKSVTDAMASEVISTYSLLCFYQSNAKKILKNKAIPHPFFKNKKSHIQYEPKGVIAVITPWNYPFYLSFAPIVSALITGNAVVFKPSEHTLMVGEFLHQLFLDAGFPKELFQIMYGDGTLGKALVESNIQKVAFTGSVKTGQAINAAVADRFLDVTLELGGKDAFVVLDDAPIDRAVNAALWGNFFNCGQTCSGVERIIVHKNIAEQFIAKLEAKFNELPLGADSPIYRTLNNKQQHEIVKKQLADAEKNSERFIQRQLDASNTGEFQIPPTFVIEPNSKAIILKDETFGPVATIQVVSSDDEAIALANSTDFGLTASVWTKKRKRAQRFARELEAGSVYVNDHISPQGAGELPWGGIKNSGKGKSRGIDGLLAMTNAKVVSIERINMTREFFWYPLNEKTLKLLKKTPFLIRWLYKIF